MEEKNAHSHRLVCPPPRPAEVPTRLPLKEIWSALEPAKRQQTLQALVRLVAQQLAKPLPGKGVANDQA